jgi:hypothetical protein
MPINQFNSDGAWTQYCAKLPITIYVSASIGAFQSQNILIDTKEEWSYNINYGKKGLVFDLPEQIGSLFFVSISATFEGASNDLLGVKFGLRNGFDGVFQYTAPTIWNSTGGTRFAINNSGLLRVYSMGSTLSFMCANLSSTTNFAMSDIVIVVHKII